MNGHNHLTLGMVLDGLDGPQGNPVYNPDRTGLIDPSGHDGFPGFDQMTGAAEFAQWYEDDASVNVSTDCTITLPEISPGVFQLDIDGFFPLDDSGAGICSEDLTGFGFGNTPGITPSHNYHFTLEIHGNFIFDLDDEFTFRGDDDVWVFIDDKLAIDLGGTHTARVQTITGAELAAAPFNLQEGVRYDFDFFFAERQSTGSSFVFTTSLGLNSVVATDDEFTTDENVVLNNNVITNANPNGADNDPNGDAFSLNEVFDSDTNPVPVGVQTALPSGALLTQNSDGTFTYDPNGAFDSLLVGETDTDSYTYTIEDNFGASSTATVTITIDGVGNGGIIQIIKDAAGADEDFGFTNDIESPFSFTLNDGIGNDFILFSNIRLGNYFVSEDNPNPLGFSLTDVTCSPDAGPGTSAIWDNDLTVDFVIANDNDVISCTFTNELTPEQGTIIVVKEAEPEIDRDFDFEISAVNESFFEPFELCDFSSPCTSGDPQTTAPDYIVPVGDYDITETFSPLSYQVTDITCALTGSSEEVTASNTDTISLNVADGEEWTCIFTNVAETGTIIIEKDTVPDDALDFEFATEGGFGTNLPSNFFLDDDADATLPNTEIFTDIPIGSYNVFEINVGPNYDVMASCDDNNSIEDEPGFVEINLEADEIVTCTFTNTFVGGPFADYGDAPDSRGTLFASNGPHHLPNEGPILGSTIDYENDGVPTGDADGDDNAGTDDEDGVNFVDALIPGDTDVEVDIVIEGVSEDSAFLNAWIDFNDDGSFDVSDQIFTDEPVFDGLNTLTFSIPQNADVGETYSRFRVDSIGGLSPLGQANDGEVEDHTVFIDCPTVNDISPIEANFILGLLVPDQFRAFGGGGPELLPCTDLSIVKSDNIDPIQVGNVLTYTLTVTNNGPDDAPDVIVEDSPPSGVSFVAATPSQGDCEFISGGVTCEIGTIQSGESATVIIQVTVNEFQSSSTLTNVASVNSQSIIEIDFSNNDAFETTAPCDDNPEPVELAGFLLGLLVPEQFRAFGGSPIELPPCTNPSDDGGLPYPRPHLGDNRYGDGHDNGFCVGLNCINVVNNYFNHYPETNINQGTTQTFTLLVNCQRGAETCIHASIGGALPDSTFYDTRWDASLDKDIMTGEWTLTVTNDHGEIGTVTGTVQEIGDTFIQVTFNIQFLIPGSVGTTPEGGTAHANNRHLHVTVYDNQRGMSNYIFNDGVYVDDIYAYPQVETSYEKSLEVERLCLNENEKKRYTCAFDKVRDWTIQQAEETLRQMYGEKGTNMDSYDESEKN